MQEDIHSPTLAGFAARPSPLVPARASVFADHPDPAFAIAGIIGPGPFALLLLFAAPQTRLDALLPRAAGLFPGTTVAGCTTAGELCEDGYGDGRIVAIGFPASAFVADAVLIDPLDEVDSRGVIAQLQRARQTLHRHAADFPHELGILMVDGLSGREEQLVASLAGGLGPVPLVGGSAGDGRRFRRTRVFLSGALHDRAAVLCLLRARAPVRVFSFDCTSPSRTQMVVTRADPPNRAILRINDEPAAQEYARLLSVPVDSLGPETFATRPLLVRAGGRHHVRSIQEVGSDGALVFFGAVAEGMVLTLAEQGDIATHLDASLRDLGRDGAPAMVLGFDCLFRRIDAEARQRTRDVSRILRDHRVAGFSTYGEQIGAMHMNQTFSGVAFYDAGTPQ
ncbi:FIST N-terminal domain-containing protein [Paracoccus spongiarum]|uniref:FIST N-terminal domain-containing protein n=1 Tax=Paracoccus spongiarum TaxID=3064387 RepID=A0ABT9JA00_9RHOB|nr:FIST N-terminal domain-containing protein [Paracoccus sp. 2205BS29-5]MDP5306638.1 FIST N-terminal domain-containing protein [Paracoccus sp. 2205BS29-5]